MHTGIFKQMHSIVNGDACMFLPLATDNAMKSMESAIAYILYPNNVYEQ